MAVEGISSVSSSSSSAASQASQSVNQIRPEVTKQAKPQDAQASQSASAASVVAAADKSKGIQFGNGKDKKDAAPGEMSLVKQQEQQIKAALENANKQAKLSHTNARFLYHDDINRISISIIDSETEEVLREYPAEETLQMLSKLYELTGMMVDEKR